MTIRWLPVSGAARYHLQVATNLQFTSMTIDDSTLVDTVTRIGPLSYSTIYFVRVRAISSSAASGFSLPVAFSTVPVPPPAPAGIALASEPEKTSATLLWRSAGGALLYHLQVSADSLFGTLALNDSTVADTVRAIVSLSQSTRYFARVRAKGLGGMGAFSPVIAFVTAGSPSASTVPKDYYLEQNYPNPFNPKTGVRFQVPGVREEGIRDQGSGVSVKLVVYDMLGREVALLVNEQKIPGSYEVTFDGSGLASGVYIYRLTAGSFVQTRTMVLLK
jgi:hypothetical protein